MADFKPVLCSFIHRYVRERRLGLGIENIHTSELLRGVGLPELRAACKEWLIGQRIMILADEMCDTRSCKSCTGAATRTTSAFSFEFESSQADGHHRDAGERPTG